MAHRDDFVYDTDSTTTSVHCVPSVFFVRCLCYYFLPAFRIAEVVLYLTQGVRVHSLLTGIIVQYEYQCYLINRSRQYHQDTRQDLIRASRS